MFAILSVKRISRSVSRAILLSGACAGVMMGAASAMAQPIPFFDTIPDGRDEFDDLVNSASGTLTLDPLSGLVGGNTWDRGAYTITATNGVNRSIDNTYLGTNAIPSVPGGQSIQMTANGQVTSGLTFTFDNPINGFGIDLGDWGTCCYPSSLYISFDGGTPILVGTATQQSDNKGSAVGQGNRTFVGAIDDSATFSVITFYGTGSGDVLYGGGIIRYAIVPIGFFSGGYVQTSTGTPAEGLASYFDGFDDNGGDRATIGTYLNTLTSPEEIAQVMKTVFPVNTSVTGQTMMSASGQTTNVLVEKVGTVLGNVGSVSSLNFRDGQADMSGWIFADSNANAMTEMGQAPSLSLSASAYDRYEPGQKAVWTEAVVAGANGDATTSTMGYDTFSRGFVTGAEFALDQTHMVGVLGSMFRTDVDVDNHAGDTEGYNYNIGLYGQKLFGATKLSGMAMVGYGDYESKRHIDVGGVTQSPRSDYDGWSGSMTAALSRLYAHDHYEFEPFASVSYTAVRTDGYTEKGGGAMNMTVSADTFSTASAKIGMAVQREMKFEDGRAFAVKLRPYVGQQWELEEASNTTRFAGAGSATTINGRDLTTFDVGLGAELRYDLDNSRSLKAGADLSRDRYEDRYVGFVGFGVKF
ncbi:autotransporter family protein [Micavibrio aeruginosavorus]|uniref:Autotransporter domain-containing protein n=1 Tax=Micavibrio aeruginosavorus EPB TaxID=349215 RepID=M4VJS3_9BACT|nr:autotransporter outer membrane beta-barrel domain-containing protein [Micavibrio aeruginosavorus]AGH98311.1 hypothetical protein A11S_1504 [Micavibrio aeruginosavorus EPB]